MCKSWNIDKCTNPLPCWQHNCMYNRDIFGLHSSTTQFRAYLDYCILFKVYLIEKMIKWLELASERVSLPNAESVAFAPNNSHRFVFIVVQGYSQDAGWTNLGPVYPDCSRWDARIQRQQERLVRQNGCNPRSLYHFTYHWTICSRLSRKTW